MADEQGGEALPAIVEFGVGLLPDPWRDKLYETLLRFAGRRVAPELVRAITEEADAARGRAILSDAIAAAGAEVLANRIKSDPELAALAIARSIDDQIDRQQNLNDILKLAAGEIAQDVSSEEHPPSEKITDDWRRKFTSFAEDVSDEQMQGVWARILAGEFKQPGTFSYRTLRLVSELSPSIAATFEKVSDQIINGDALVTLGEEWNEGENFMAAKALEDWGILQDSPGQSARLALKRENDLYGIPNGNLIGVLRIPDGPDRLSYSIALLTEPGRQLYRLLPRKDERIVLRKILKDLFESNPTAEWAKIALAQGLVIVESVSEQKE
ncbi:MAG: DUF2806 domain-containing protein [Porphyrobacter sp. IPPAS B-1204]|nr:MAG: DUF2806 domain-containing protein [Porphyrobacter sp. IPPAS B-1204]